MANVDISVSPGETKRLTFLSKDKYTTENIEFDITSEQTETYATETDLENVEYVVTTAFNNVKNVMGVDENFGVDFSDLVGHTAKTSTNIHDAIKAVESESHKFIDAASATLSSGKLTVTIPNQSSRMYHIYVATASVTRVTFTIGDNAKDIEHYLLLVNNTGVDMTLSGVGVTNLTDVFYPEDIANHVVGADEALEISVIQRGTTAVVTMGGTYKK